MSLLLITIVLTSFYNIPFECNQNEIIQYRESSSIHNEDEVKEEPINFENLKSADLTDEQLNHNFSFNTVIKESWNQTYSFWELNST
jgi:hypothetical protein